MNHSEIGVVCTNLAIVWGPDFVDDLPRLVIFIAILVYQRVAHKLGI